MLCALCAGLQGSALKQDDAVCGSRSKAAGGPRHPLPVPLPLAAQGSLWYLPSPGWHLPPGPQSAGQNDWWVEASAGAVGAQRDQLVAWAGCWALQTAAWAPPWGPIPVCREPAGIVGCLVTSPLWVWLQAGAGGPLQQAVCGGSPAGAEGTVEDAEAQAGERPASFPLGGPGARAGATAAWGPSASRGLWGLGIP